MRGRGRGEEEDERGSRLEMIFQNWGVGKEMGGVRKENPFVSQAG